MMVCLQSWAAASSIHATPAVSTFLSKRKNLYNEQRKQHQGSVPAAWCFGRRDSVGGEQRQMQMQMQMEMAAAAEEECCKRQRRHLLMGIGALAATALISPTPLLATAAEQETPAKYQSFVDVIDGYSYVYPSDWREFEFRGHDSAFKDRYLQLQNVRVRFLPTDKQDIHDIGPLDKVVPELVKNIYAAPNQLAYIYDMQERKVNGKTYYTFEYMLRSPIYACASFATIAVANGRFYTLTVGANDRRWRRVRNQLKVVADSFTVLDI